MEMAGTYFIPSNAFFLDKKRECAEIIPPGLDAGSKYKPLPSKKAISFYVSRAESEQDTKALRYVESGAGPPYFLAVWLRPKPFSAQVTPFLDYGVFGDGCRVTRLA